MGNLSFGRAVAPVAVVVAVAVAASGALAGCGKPAAQSAATQTPEATTSSSLQAPPTQSPRTAKWIDLQPGDCLAELPPTDPAVVTVTVVDCTSPHLAEAYLRVSIPVDSALTGTANTQCGAGLAQYAGTAASAYAITYLIDSDQDRTSNNPYPSTVICLLQGIQGQSLSGSAKH